ncbi:MAG: deoxyribose-phosphate aldolase, partial [Planctomycetota bacterium]
VSSIKAAEARQAIGDGATEIDMVLDLGSLCAGEDQAVIDDIGTVVTAADGHIVKVICESHLLDDQQIERSCAAVSAAGAHFIKTCTGFSGGDATAAAVRLMRRCVAPHVRVKASGGIRDRTTAEALLAAGADRLGCSATQAILTGADAATTSY